MGSYVIYSAGDLGGWAAELAEGGRWRILAYCIGRELDPDAVRRLLGRAFPRWDEPITIGLDGGGEAHVFAFGVAVFFLPPGRGVPRGLLEELRRAAEAPAGEPFTEEYQWVPGEAPRRGRGLRVHLPGGLVVVRDEAIYGPLDEEARRIVALVLAQSAALRRLEAEVDALLEQVEAILEGLVSSRLPRARGAREGLLRALRARSTLVGDLLILEKPRSAWEDERYERLLEGLRYVFEIEERYAAVSRKLQSAVETIEAAVGLVSETRFLFLETLIVLFFLLDILIALLRP